MTDLKPIVAIDGPAGSGKSTVARAVARKLGLFYIDTGAMYRALALKARQEAVDPNDAPAVIALARHTRIDLSYDPREGTLRVDLDGRDVSQDIRRPEITEHVSVIAKIKEVREIMVGLQRSLAEGRRAILEGRDIGTVVFPDAYKKFFLDAACEERVRRRYLEMKEKNIPVEQQGVQNDIETRDRIDSTRACAPLRRTPDAVYIDTTRMTIDEVVAAVIAEINR
ncbi:cytidylate kinase [Candidatus Velamenicoccus archaeovorus]|uniref:Cytidylate kinase n=1 Tax=Velamenicoccus archaeovorus TaxID=1930593 RepID=A0A410P487_VELA1|nr:(d)CMP kinase [Candidatus Velamenicoccus archaeovorus]QAT16933.1 cytidylate kinase [Candidatus Velamenicoccus archaeovorus]